MLKQVIKHSVLIAALIGASAATYAQSSKDTGPYLVDSSGQVVKNSTGLCWRTGYWTLAAASCECDKDLLPKEKCEATGAAAKAGGAKPTQDKITLNADTLFDFDKATLRPEGKAALDELYTKVKRIKLEVLIAVGHADRIGDEKYNQKLSERRAETVKAYLVSKGIEKNRIYTEGKGEKNPVTKPEDCPKGDKRSEKLIKCLQPDRRVDVEAVGIYSWQ
jgi:OOP family OmpA-OmpF porin